MKRVTILGATGSIGTQTLDVISQNPDDFEVVALTASESVEKMAELIQRFCPSYAVMKNEEKAEELRKLLPNHSCEILYGMDGFVAVSTLPNVDVVVAAMVGMIGLRPVMEAIRAGKDIALANKETLVTAGHIIMPLAKEYGVSILPVDSEHSAIFQCLQGMPEKKMLKKLGKKKYNVLFAEGVHENFDLLEEYPVEQWCGGKTRLISGNLRQLMRGQYYTIAEKTVFAFGGGQSEENNSYLEPDEEKSWIKELPTDEELEEGLRNLEQHGNEADFIISYEPPARMIEFIDIGKTKPSFVLDMRRVLFQLFVK